MISIDTTRPSNLYRYSEERWLYRSLRLGEFRLRPASSYAAYEDDAARGDDELIRVHRSSPECVTITNMQTGKRIRPIGDVSYRTEVGTDYLTLCFSARWDVRMFDEFSETDACLVVRDVEQFSERLHESVESMLPSFSGVDGPIVYLGRSPLGAVFTKYLSQQEWRFAWRPRTSTSQLQPVMVAVGNIEDIAEIVRRPTSSKDGARTECGGDL